MVIHERSKTLGGESLQLSFNFDHPNIPKGIRYGYARVGGPPDRWLGLRIFNRDTGEEYLDVTEVDAISGWLTRYIKRDDGSYCYNGDCLIMENLYDLNLIIIDEGDI